MSTFEEHKSVVLQACFKDKNRHRRLVGHKARTFDFQFHPAEDVALSASEDGTARVWDLSNSRCVKALEGHSTKHEVLRACWAPTATANASVAMATGSADGTVRLWGILQGSETDGMSGVGRYQALKVVGQLRHRNESKGLDGQVYSCQFVPERGDAPARGVSSNSGPTRLLTASDSSVHLWDVNTRKRIASRALSKVGDHSIGGERNPDDLSFIFDAKPRPGAGSTALAVALSDGTVRIGDILGTDGQTAVLKGNSDTHLTSLAWSEDGATLASCGGDGTVTVWDARTWTVRAVMSGHSRPVYGAAFYPADKAAVDSEAGVPQLLLSWSSDGTVCAWDAGRASGDDSAPLATLSVEKGFPIYSCCVSPDGRRLAVAGGGGDAKAGFMGVPIKLIELSDEAIESGERGNVPGGERSSDVP